jgi:hypothetical protein
VAPQTFNTFTTFTTFAKFAKFAKFNPALEHPTLIHRNAPCLIGRDAPSRHNFPLSRRRQERGQGVRDR